ncbi:hypothetical protein VH79_26190 [Salmonella enterica]|uniref:Uncharacterized protein n=1 Tax=Salmonella enterica TaxID=28901 RepID=A0A5U3IX17_SALER|nr:hypothetical protein [Salmonella enterica]
MIYITAKREGFARCGVRFSETTTAYEESRFTPEQLADLEAEPMLIVTRELNAGTAAQAEEQIHRLRDALNDAQHQIVILTSERDALMQQLGEMTEERDTLLSRLPPAGDENSGSDIAETVTGSSENNDAVDETDVSDVETGTGPKKPASRAGTKTK